MMNRLHNALSTTAPSGLPQKITHSDDFVDYAVSKLGFESLSKFLVEYELFVC